MFHAAGLTRLTATLAVALVLAACATTDDNSSAPTTGRQSSFQLTGDISAVDVEDVDVDVDASVGPRDIDVDAGGGVTVQVTVRLEEINDEAAQLCDLQVGGDAVVVVNEDTDLQFDRPLAELGTLDDESVTATGTALELTGETAEPVVPGGTCSLTALTLDLAEEPEASPTP